MRSISDQLARPDDFGSVAGPGRALSYGFKPAFFLEDDEHGFQFCEVRRLPST
jgi:hypothetical protein